MDQPKGLIEQFIEIVDRVMEKHQPHRGTHMLRSYEERMLVTVDDDGNVIEFICDYSSVTVIDVDGEQVQIEPPSREHATAFARALRKAADHLDAIGAQPIYDNSPVQAAGQ